MAITVKRPEGVVEFCTDLALRAAWEQAVAELDQARTSGDQRLGNAEVAERAHTVQNLEQQMAEVTLRFRLRALSRRRWQELGEEHSPRDGNKQDQAMGVNIATFFDAVAMESIFAVNEKVSGRPVDFDAKAEWLDLADEMTDGQYRQFVDEILSQNRSVTAAPFSRTASLLIQASEESSN